MKRFAPAALYFGLLLAACTSETALVATLDGRGGAGGSSVSAAGGSSGSATAGMAGSIPATSGGTGQDSGGAPVLSGGVSGASTAASGGNSGTESGGSAAGAGLSTGGAQAGGASSGGSAAAEAGAGGGDNWGTYCSCSQSQTVCDSDGVTHLCFGNQCPPIMIICEHECPCGAGENTGGNRGEWYPEECFDESACADTYFCVVNSPETAALATDCATLRQ